MEHLNPASELLSHPLAQLDLFVAIATVILDHQLPVPRVEFLETILQAQEHRLLIVFALGRRQATHELFGLYRHLSMPGTSDVFKKNIRREAVNVTRESDSRRAIEAASFQRYAVERFIGEGFGVRATAKFEEAYKTGPQALICSTGFFPIMGKKSEQGVEIFLPQGLLVSFHGLRIEGRNTSRIAQSTG